MATLPTEGRALCLDPARGEVGLRRFPVHPPRPGEVLLRVLRANVCGSDLHMVRGDAFRAMAPPHPIVLGHEAVGRVLALGEGVERDARGEGLAPGDRVSFAYWRGCGACPVCARGQGHACLGALLSLVRDCERRPHFHGAFADCYMVRRGQAVVKVPDGLGDALAAGANCALAQVIAGLRRARVGLGDQVVIQGAGGLGLWATAVARAMGAARVIVIDAVPRRLELARAFGADRTVSLEEHPDPRERTRQVLAETGGGAQVCVEVVGRAQVLREGVRMLQRGGRYLVMGSIVPGDTFEADPSLWVGGNLSILGVSLYDLDSLLEAVRFADAAQGRLPLETMVGEVFPLESWREAFEAADALASGRASAGRVAFRIAEEEEALA
ncbi:MAG: zinc-binding dehydrogenase [Planctomycetes bacterium]|nr:zinc-binding dehydrogenase [Planctomycetota bacterium]